ncbi:hypothetical protein F4808DRAFT_473487 [Astrocystis sublimbata]|nr:hypothetical protein F4808DRAFT_473487 [Astrocystis sublimbata]
MADDLPLRLWPSSPWAVRWPYQNAITIVENNKKHSEFKPRIPTINDPKYYDRDPDLANPEPPLSYDELDFGFLSEFSQRWVNRVTTWEAAALNRWVVCPEAPAGYVSSGHNPTDKVEYRLPTRGSPNNAQDSSFGSSDSQRSVTSAEIENLEIFKRGMIEVDETTWLPFLQKSRWYDWIEVPEAYDHDHPVREWSVDDDTVWAPLKLSLELANRMLNALIEDKNEGVTMALETIIWGRIDYWEKFKDIFGDPSDPLDTVLLGYEVERQIAEKRNHSFRSGSFRRRTPAQWRERLIGLLKRLTWGIGDGGDDILGSTVHLVYRKEPLHYTIHINIIHELMHAILKARSLDDSAYRGNRLDPAKKELYFKEPYYNANGVPEAGHYMEQEFFGGAMHITPGEPAPPLRMVITRFPYTNCTHADKPAPTFTGFQPDSMRRLEHVPTTWASKMLTRAFWDDPSTAKSVNFFHRNAMFVAEGRNKDPRPDIVKTTPAQAAWYDEDSKVLSDWNSKTRLYIEYRRGWYDDALSEWDGSPWRYSASRQNCYDFKVAFDRRDLLTCTKIAKKLANVVKWENNNPQLYLNLMPINGRKRTLWAWHCVGLLMLASIPAMTVGLFRGAENPGGRSMELTPSREAAAAGYETPLYFAVRSMKSERQVEFPARVWDHINGKGLLDYYTQEDCLDLIDDIMYLFVNNDGIAHSSFITNIILAKDALNADRQRITDAYKTDTACRSKWSSDWFFEIPSYNPTEAKINADGTIEDLDDDP